jgi:hypothetical protein
MMDVGSGGRKRGGGRIWAGKPDDLMPGADQLGNDGGSDISGRAGEEDAHQQTSERSISAGVIR